MDRSAGYAPVVFVLTFYTKLGRCAPRVFRNTHGVSAARRRVFSVIGTEIARLGAKIREKTRVRTVGKIC